ncbi:MAG: four helix bundle protein [Bradymonadaceae bacterium]
MSSENHKKLETWNKARALVSSIYSLTEGFPKQERYGLTSQMRRATVSIPSQIAEGAARRTRKDYLRFLYMARASLSELDTQLILSNDLGLITDARLTEFQDFITHLASKLQSQINGLEEGTGS